MVQNLTKMFENVILLKFECEKSRNYNKINHVYVFILIVAPRCKPGTEQMSVGAMNMHNLEVKCEVEADPADTIRFSWTYNNTRNVSPVSIIFNFILAFK